MALRETYAVLGNCLRRLWFILPSFGRIRKSAIPLAVQVHHPHKVGIRVVRVIWV
jgi:hypothetical protein